MRFPCYDVEVRFTLIDFVNEDGIDKIIAKRPHRLRPHRPLPPHPRTPTQTRNVWPVTIERTVFLGDMTQAHNRWAGRDLVVRQTSLPFTPVQPATLSIDPAHCVLLEAG